MSVSAGNFTDSENHQNLSTLVNRGEQLTKDEHRPRISVVGNDDADSISSKKKRKRRRASDDSFEVQKRKIAFNFEAERWESLENCIDPDAPEELLEKKPYFLTYRVAVLEEEFILSSIKSPLLVTSTGILVGTAYLGIAIVNGYISQGHWTGYHALIINGTCFLLAIINLVVMRMGQPPAVQKTTQDKTKKCEDGSPTRTETPPIPNRPEMESSNSALVLSDAGESDVSSSRHRTDHQENKETSSTRLSGGRSMMSVSPSTTDDNSRITSIEDFMEIRQRKLTMAKRNEILSLALFINCGLIFVASYAQNELCFYRQLERDGVDRATAYNQCNQGLNPYLALMQSFPVAAIELIRPNFAIPLVPLPLLCWLACRAFAPVDTVEQLLLKLLCNVVFTSVVAAYLYSWILDRRRHFEAQLLVLRHTKRLERRRSELDRTLQVVLPPSITAKLLAGKPFDISHRCTFSCSRIDDFAAWSCTVMPSTLVNAIDSLFCLFDEAATPKFGLTKLKIVGDIYVAADGLHSSSPSDSSIRNQQPSSVAELSGTTSTTAASPGSLSGHLPPPSPDRDLLDDIRSLISTHASTSSVRFAHWCLRTARRLSLLLGLRFSVKAALHTGPCFGGILGTESLWYEFYGEAFEVAAEVVQRAAKGGEVLCTGEVLDACRGEFTGTQVAYSGTNHHSMDTDIKMRGLELDSYEGAIFAIKNSVAARRQQSSSPKNTNNNLRADLSKGVVITAEGTPEKFSSLLTAESGSPSTVNSTPHRRRFLASRQHQHTKVGGDGIGFPLRNDTALLSSNVREGLASSASSVSPLINGSNIINHPAQTMVESSGGALHHQAPTTPMVVNEDLEGKQQEALRHKLLVERVRNSQRGMKALSQREAILAQEKEGTLDTLEMEPISSNGLKKKRIVVPVSGSLEEGGEGNDNSAHTSTVKMNDQMSLHQQENGELNAPAFVAPFFGLEEATLLRDRILKLNRISLRFVDSWTESEYRRRSNEVAFHALRRQLWPVMTIWSLVLVFVCSVEGSITPVAAGLLVGNLCASVVWLLVAQFLKRLLLPVVDITLALLWSSSILWGCFALKNSVLNGELAYILYTVSLVSIHCLMRLSWFWSGISIVVFFFQLVAAVILRTEVFKASTFLAAGLFVIFSQFASYFWDLRRREQFRDQLIGEVFDEAADNEDELQTAMLDMLVPPTIVDIVTAKSMKERDAIIESLGEVSVLVFRFDQFTELLASSSLGRCGATPSSTRGWSNSNTSAGVIGPGRVSSGHGKKLPDEEDGVPLIEGEISATDDDDVGIYRGHQKRNYQAADVEEEVWGGDPRAALKTMEALFAAIEQVVAREAPENTLRNIEKVYTLGDRVLVAGPLLEHEESAAGMLQGHMSKSNMKAVRSAAKKIPPKSKNPHVVAATERMLDEEDVVLKASTSLFDTVAGLRAEFNHSVTFSAILHSGEAFAAVLGVQRPVFTLLGPVTRTAEALMDAAPSGCLAASNAFRTMMNNGRVLFPRQNCEIQATSTPTCWKVRGAGVVKMLPIVSHLRDGDRREIKSESAERELGSTSSAVASSHHADNSEVSFSMRTNLTNDPADDRSFNQNLGSSSTQLIAPNNGFNPLMVGGGGGVSTTSAGTDYNLSLLSMPPMPSAPPPMESSTSPRTLESDRRAAPIGGTILLDSSRVRREISTANSELERATHRSTKTNVDGGTTSAPGMMVSDGNNC